LLCESASDFIVGEEKRCISEMYMSSDIYWSAIRGILPL
jgi:hypothetical protein